MLKRFCDCCGEEVNAYIPDLDRDSKTQFYTLVKDRGLSSETECDICNTCLKKIIEGRRGEK